MRGFAAVLCIFGLLVFHVSAVLGKTGDQWKSRIIYQVRRNATSAVVFVACMHCEFLQREQLHIVHSFL